jgi:hypothetical protein
MPGNRLMILLNRPQVSPPRARRPPVGQGAHQTSGLGIQKNPVRPYEFQCIPLNRVVARGQDQSCRCPMVLDCQLHRGGGHDAEVDDIHPHRHETGCGGTGKHVTAGAGIASQDDCGPGGTRPGPGARRPGPQGSGVPGHQLGGEVRSNVTPDTRDADHQAIGHDRGQVIGSCEPPLYAPRNASTTSASK